MLKKLDVNKIKMEIKAKMPVIKAKLLSLRAEYDKDAIIYTALIIGIIGYGLYKFIIPGLFQIPGNISELNRQKSTAIQMEQIVKIAEKPVQTEKKIELPVKIYELAYKDVELENAATGIINQVISLIRQSGQNTVESFTFENKDLTDRAGLKSPNHAILSLKIQMTTTYENLQNFLNEIFLMEYLIIISDISVNSNNMLTQDRVSAHIVLDIVLKTL